MAPRAKEKAKTAKDVRAPQRGVSRGRRASGKSEKYRFAQNVGEAGTAAEREYEAYALSDIEDPRGDPDVLLDVPVVKVDSIHLEVDDLDARVALKAQVLDLVKLNVGVDVHLGKLRIDIKGVEAQALLKVRLDRVTAIVDRVLTTIDRNPELVKSLGRTAEQIGEGTGHALGETGEAVEDVGQGAGQAVGEVGQGAGQAVGELGEGASQAVGEVGEGAGQAVGQLDQTLQGVGDTAGQALGQAGEVAGQAGQAAGQAGQAAGQAGQAAGGLLGGEGGGNGGGGGGGLAGASASGIAKLAAKAVAEELKASAKEEAKELGLAAARKAKRVGERRKQRKAEELNATEVAMRTAEELEVDLEEVEGSGPEGRVTIRDVKRAQEQAQEA
ncbi:MAG TPA: E3 binding domain-containing protein [Solirubrobacterales bacterium]|nr:E3 binding domain-containing protein [Solirubrobacterales bacterium]